LYHKEKEGVRLNSKSNSVKDSTLQQYIDISESSEGTDSKKENRTTNGTLPKLSTRFQHDSAMSKVGLDLSDSDSEDFNKKPKRISSRLRSSVTEEIVCSAAWTCKLCTYVNETDPERCELCDSPRGMHTKIYLFTWYQKFICVLQIGV